MERNTAEIVVKVYAVLSWLGALFSVIAALGMFFVGSLGSMGAFGGMMGADAMMGGAVLGAIGIFGGILLLGIAVLEVFVGLGLWKHQSWARIVTLVFSVLGVLSIFGGNILSAVIGAVGVWLFGFDETVKGLFGAASAPAAKKKL